MKNVDSKDSVTFGSSVCNDKYATYEITEVSQKRVVTMRERSDHRTHHSLT